MFSTRRAIRFVNPVTASLAGCLHSNAKFTSLVPLTRSRRVVSRVCGNNNNNVTALRAMSSNSNNSNKTVERPISPHVTIYKFPLPAITSITNRFTGVALSIGFSGMGLVALCGGCDIPSLVHSFQSAAPVLVPIAKMLVAFPLSFHFVAGLRHIYWDLTAKHLDLPSVDKSSQAIIAISAVTTLFFAFYWI